MKILVIEDNRDTADTLQEILSEWYVVEVAWSGRIGSYQARTIGYGLIVLDLVLGDIDGLEVCKAIRAKPLATPILVVSGKYQVTDKVKALAAGADDYLTKPFDKRELLARVQALLRRPAETMISPTLAWGDLVIHEGERRVTYKKELISLRRKEFDLLEYLVRCHGQVVTRGMILDHVWGSDVDQFSNTVDVHVKYLRDKIDRRFNVQLIKTVPGVGYQITS